MTHSKQIDISTASSLDCVKSAHIHEYEFRKWELKKKMMKTLAHSHTKHCKMILKAWTTQTKIRCRRCQKNGIFCEKHDFYFYLHHQLMRCHMRNVDGGIFAPSQSIHNPFFLWLVPAIIIYSAEQI